MNFGVRNLKMIDYDATMEYMYLWRAMPTCHHDDACCTESTWSISCCDVWAITK